MPRAKKDIAQKDQVADLKDRLEQFIKINNHSLGTAALDDWERERLLWQNQDFVVVLGLIKQLQKKGEIWRGGYDDNAGAVVYEDQVQQILDDLESD